MRQITENRRPYGAAGNLPHSCGGRHATGERILLVSTIIIMMTLSACGGGGGSSSIPQQSAKISGNWQYTMMNAPGSAVPGGLQGGFLLQNNGSVTGAVVFSMVLQSDSGATVCDSGSAPVTGTINGQNVTLTAVAGGATFILTGMLSSGSTTMSGTYTSTAPPPCGTTRQQGRQW